MSLLNECPLCGAALDPGEKCDCQEKKLTRGDQIRQMTDEELAEKFRNALCDLVPECKSYMQNCTECILNYLKEEDVL